MRIQLPGIEQLPAKVRLSVRASLIAGT